MTGKVLVLLVCALAAWTVTAQDWTNCPTSTGWIENDKNTDGQWIISYYVSSPDECISLAQSSGCDIANIDTTGSGACYCQYGSDGGTDGSGWMACWLWDDPVAYLEDWEYTEEAWDSANDCCFYRYAYELTDRGCCDGMSCSYSNSMYSWDWRRRLSESGGESVERGAHRALGHCCDEDSWCSCMHEYIANGVNECEGDDEWRATATSGCSQATDGTACTSDDGNGGYDCWAGSEHEECTCAQGEAKETGNVLEYEGDTYYEYTCCPAGTEGTVGEECGDCCIDVGAIIAAIIGGVVGGILFCVCVGVLICYFAKCACFAPPAGAQVTPGSTQVQVAPPQGQVMQAQVLQPQVMQPQVMQPQVMQPRVMQPGVIMQPQAVPIAKTL